MSAAKNIIVFGLLADIEASYGAGGSLVAGTNGILMADTAVATLDFVHKGDRPPGAGTGNTFKRTAKSGLFLQMPVKVEARGLGSAYTTGVNVAQDLHTLLRASGHDMTLNTGTWTATISAPFTEVSAVMKAYTRGQEYAITGAYADMGFSIDGPGPMVFDFAVSGQCTTPTDVALPAITYSALAVLPPKAESLALTIGTFTAGVVRKIMFKRNQNVKGPRTNINTTGHSGFSMGRRNPTIEITVEAVALATSNPYHTATTFNPYKLRELATALAITFGLNGGTNNKINFSASNCQLIDVKDDGDDPDALWVLTFECKPSSPILQDDYTITLTA